MSDLEMQSEEPSDEQLEMQLEMQSEEPSDEQLEMQLEMQSGAITLRECNPT